MRVTFFDWEKAKSLLQRLLGQLAYESVTAIDSPAAAGTAFSVPHTLPTGITPNSIAGTVMSGGFIYYYECDRQLWTPNTSTQQGVVMVRCSIAQAPCEIRIRAYDNAIPVGSRTGLSPTSGTGITGLAFGGTGTDLSATGGAGQYVKQAGVGAVFTVGLIPAADVPFLDASKIATGQLALARGGTAADLSTTGGANQIVKQSTLGGAF